MAKTLKEMLIKDAKVPENEISNYTSDLHVLYTDDRMDFINDNYEFANPSIVEVFVSDVKGQDWYGKRVIEIKFAYTEYHK